MRRLRRWRPFTARWQREANRQARSFAPTVVPCRFCGAPKVTGYTCWRCDDEPSNVAGRAELGTEDQR